MVREGSGVHARDGKCCEVQTEATKDNEDWEGKKDREGRRVDGRDEQRSTQHCMV